MAPPHRGDRSPIAINRRCDGRRGGGTIWDSPPPLAIAAMPATNTAWMVVRDDDDENDLRTIVMNDDNDDNNYYYNHATIDISSATTAMMTAIVVVGIRAPRLPSAPARSSDIAARPGPRPTRRVCDRAREARPTAYAKVANCATRI